MWIAVIILLMSGLLFLNYSNNIDYVKLDDYRIPNPTAGAAVTCAMFQTQKEAQEFFDSSDAVANKYGLDGDHDGQVCESLP